MAMEIKTGGDLLLDFQRALSTVNDDDPVLGNVINVAQFAIEEWSSLTVDPEASSGNYRFTSTEGSSLRFSFQQKESGASYSYADSFSFSTKPGDSLNGSSSESSDNQSESSSFKLTWKYVGDKSDKEDDVSFVMTNSDSGRWWSTSTGSAGSGSEAVSISYKDSEYSFKVAITGTGRWEWNDVQSKNVVDAWTSKISKYEFTDSGNDFSLAFTGAVSGDDVALKDNIDFKNVWVSTIDYTFVTKTFKETLLDSELDGIELLPPSLKFGGIYEDYLKFESLLSRASNVFTVKSKDGVAFDAGAASDTLIGGAGDDTLKGGAGMDVITGGRGDDIFVFSFGDSDAVSGKADQIRDFKVGEDRIQLVGLQTIEATAASAVQKSFSAAASAADLDVAGGSNVSVQFLGSNAIVFADLDGNNKVDFAVTLVGVKLSTPGFSDYIASAEMFFVA